MKNPNVLILDEPTNDLDIPTLNALEDFLAELNVCLLVISHDRFFMDKICGRLLVFEGDGHIKEFVGNYTELRERKRVEKLRLSQANAQARNAAVEAAQQEKVEKPRTKKLTYAERLELQKIDKEMPKLEAKKAELVESMGKTGVDHHRIMELSLELEKTGKRLDEITDRWLVLSEKE